MPHLQSESPLAVRPTVPILQLSCNRKVCPFASPRPTTSRREACPLSLRFPAELTEGSQLRNHSSKKSLHRFGRKNSIRSTAFYFRFCADEA
ncbi:hypothetical protein JZ751_025405 [Albula glossodonta]|uniref:Uncharacterized protein n=1 Tax=Albula glossodonta TaxID=121402 RepID=A0A8T2NG78_9TELE|nr:hypothetical protein JZ751_025405 [Albula glossodonta]